MSAIATPKATVVVRRPRRIRLRFVSACGIVCELVVKLIFSVKALALWFRCGLDQPATLGRQLCVHPL